MVMRDLRLHKV